MVEISIDEFVRCYENDLKKKWNISERIDHKRRVLEYHEPHNLTREIVERYNLEPEQAKCFDTEFRETYKLFKEEYRQELKRLNAPQYTKAEEKAPSYTPALQMPAMAEYENIY